MKETAALPEKELFTRMAAGDEHAFAECVRRFTPSLFAYVQRMVQADGWAEDLLQDLFIWLWKNRAKLNAVENPGGYLTRMATNLSLNFIRRRSLEVVAQYQLTHLKNEPGIGPDADRHDRQYYAGLLQEAVERLTPQQQRIYRLRYEDSLSYDQIAEELALSRNTVRNHLAAAMESMRGYLKEHAELLLLISVLIKNSLK